MYWQNQMRKIETSRGWVIYDPETDLYLCLIGAESIIRGQKVWVWSKDLQRARTAWYCKPRAITLKVCAGIDIRGCKVLPVQVKNNITKLLEPIPEQVKK